MQHPHVALRYHYLHNPNNQRANKKLHLSFWPILQMQLQWRLPILHHHIRFLNPQVGISNTETLLNMSLMKIMGIVPWQILRHQGLPKAIISPIPIQILLANSFNKSISTYTLATLGHGKYVKVEFKNKGQPQ